MQRQATMIEIERHLVLIAAYLLLFAVSCGSGAATETPFTIAESSTAAPGSEPAATLQHAVSQPTLPVVKQPAPQATVADIGIVNINLKQEVFFDGGAEMGSAVPRCHEILFNKYQVPIEAQEEFVVNQVVPPQLREIGSSTFFLAPEVLQDSLDLCIYGFPNDELIEIRLYNPDGQYVSSKTLDERDYYYSAIGDITIVDVPMYLPRSLPGGQWHLTVTSASAKVEGPLDVVWSAQTGISIVDLSHTDPFNDLPNGGACYSAPHEVFVAGNGYEPNKKRPLGVYTSTGRTDGGIAVREIYELVHSQLVTVDRLGTFVTAIPVASSVAGTYCIIVPISEMGNSEPLIDPMMPEVECYSVCQSTSGLYLTEPNMSGSDVTAVQQRLKDLGYAEAGEPDGVFGARTDAAVRHFQKVNALAESGVVDERTRQLLFGNGAIPKPFERNLYLTQPNMTGDDIAAVQQRLRDLGYTDVGSADGDFGPKTDAVVRQFQRANMLTENGIVDKHVWQILFSKEAVLNR